jgi:nitrogen fixation NifU-like protein
MDEPDGTGTVHGDCGDTFEMFIRVVGDRLKIVSFMTNGCAPMVACGSVLAKLAERKTLEQARSLTEQDIMKVIEKLPEENQHCPEMALTALKQAIEEHSKSG